jgi:hypothetical protein
VNCGCRESDRKEEEPLSSSGPWKAKVLVKATVPSRARGVASEWWYQSRREKKEVLFCSGSREKQVP